MILVGNQRAGGKDLALHLLKSENEHVEVHELRGFVSDNLMGALNEAYAISRGTRCKQFLFSLSLNPPSTENVPTEAFESAIERVEEKLGLTGQPRAIVFHEKEGRRHCHAVWSRIKADEMKAVQLSHSERKMCDVARELFLEHGWEMPHGLMNSKERDPRNFTHAQWQQAKRAKKDPREIKAAFQDCWAVSDSQAAFAQALKSRGYTLAQGDRGFVALDFRTEVYAVSKWVGIRVKEVRAKLKDIEALPSVEEARQRIAEEMASRLSEIENEQKAAFGTRLVELKEKADAMARKHKAERQALLKAHKKRRQAETAARQKRFNKGLRAALDWLTGRRRQIKQQNEQEARRALLRDRREKDDLIFRQKEERRRLQARMNRLESLMQQRGRDLRRDISQYEGLKRQRSETLSRSKQRPPEKRQRPGRGRSPER